ncbi:MAG: hypothetical protein HQK91_06010 [Nitrospirae bacterium]|nr:hypothetical protein [Nitrospirota bacterium]MBF0540988.1 hypothetical protein [Nitrospirota bacterium]
MDINKLKEIEEMLMSTDAYFDVKIWESYKLVTEVPCFENYNTVETVH